MNAPRPFSSAVLVGALWLFWSVPLSATSSTVPAPSSLDEFKKIFEMQLSELEHLRSDLNNLRQNLESSEKNSIEAQKTIDRLNDSIERKENSIRLLQDTSERLRAESESLKVSLVEASNSLDLYKKQEARRRVKSAITWSATGLSVGAIAGLILGALFL